MTDNNSINSKYKKELPKIILSNYSYLLPIIIVILLGYSISDIYLRKIPIIVTTRILPIFFSIVLLIIKYTKYRHKYSVVQGLNTLLGISTILMGFGIVVILIDTEIFKSAISALIMCILVVFFFIKGKSSIYIVYAVPVPVILLTLIFWVNPNKAQVQELIMPLVVYITLFIISISQEKTRFSEFFYKFSLLDEKNKTEALYQESSNQNKELQTQKEEILSINEQLGQRKEEMQINLEVISDLNKQLKLKNKAITDSINYARRIQEAILPTDVNLGKVLKDYFILYKPCNIVSGDFYWLHSNNDFEVIAAVDCTGHGVPGGFMSMLSYSLLNDVVQNSEIISASSILNNLKEKLKQSLNQDQSSDSQLDGLDIALCLIDKKKNTIQFAGAYMPVTVVRNDELIHYKGDKMPIGRYVKEIPSFTNHEISIQDGDTYYLYSDGYQDQMGGDENTRFLSKNLRKMLLEIEGLPFAEQKDILDKTFVEWKGNNDQMDDIMIIGFKL